MLQLTIPVTSLFDEETETFIETKEYHLTLEHSLVSVSKWEAKWKIPFFGDKKKTREQSIDYIRCMTLTQNVDPNAYFAIRNKDIDLVNEYINDNKTATWFSKHDDQALRKGRGSSKVVTSELIYYYMTIYNIPMECQKWHLSRLVTLIRVCALESAPKKDMPLQEIYKQNSALNRARLSRMKTRG